MKVKAGYKTSEFWFTLVSFLFSGLYLTGILTENAQKEELITVVSHAVESCILIGGQLIILYRYVKGRNEIKKTWWNQIDKIPQGNDNEENTTEKVSNGNSRKSKKQTTRVSKKQPKKSR